MTRILSGAVLAALAAMGAVVVYDHAGSPRQEPAQSGHKRRRHKAPVISDPLEPKPQRYHKGESPADLAAISAAAAKRARKAEKRLQIAKGK